jgi:hypothetical protein
MLLETALGVTARDVLNATEAELIVPPNVPVMSIP